jgi:hypothetical protein
LCFSSYQIAASGWLTPYLADALTLEACKSKVAFLGPRGLKPRKSLDT